MSQLIAPTHSVVDHIPLGRRISEIMQEMGPAYTISAMAKRLDVSRETLRLMFKGEREIYNYELYKIAQDLKLPVERILQTDVLEKRQRFYQMMADFKNLEEAQELSDFFLQTALGSIEKIYALYWKGRYFYVKREYQSAHEVWLEGLTLAWGVLKKYGESEIMLRLAGNVSITYSFRHDKKALLELTDQVKEYFDEHPIYSGIICYSLGRIHRNEGNLDLMLEQLYLGLSYIENSQLPNHIFKARYQVARGEYQIGNYRKALEVYENTFEFLKLYGDLHTKSGYYVNYGKCLMRLHEFERARQALDMAEEIFRGIKVIDHVHFKYEQELLFVLAIVRNDPAYAVELAHREEFDVNCRKLACKYLADTYERAGDAEQAETYRNLLRHRKTLLDLALHEKEQDPIFLLSMLEFCLVAKWYVD